MAFSLNGQTLNLDRPFTTEDGRQFPSNWLRLSSLAEKEALGITEIPDQPTANYDQRFYWSPDLPKRLEDEPAVDENGDPILDADGIQIINKGLKSNWIAQQKQIAGTLLAPTDWYVTRKSEKGTEIPADVLTYREAIRTVCDAREAEISACTTTDELAALLTNSATIYDVDSGLMVDNTEPFITAWPVA